MGYMGFGMRKEDYKRKPKRPSKKMKRYKAPPPEDGSTAGHKASQTYQRIRFKPAYKRVWFWVVAILIITALAYNFLETRVFSKNRGLAEIALFEESGFKEYYESEKPFLDSLIQFVKARERKIGGIGLNFFGDIMLIKVRSENYHSSIKGHPKGDQHRGQFNLKSDPEPEVIDGKLRFNINERQVIYEHHWSYDIEVKYIRDVNTTFMEHLETNYNELDAIIRKLANKKYELSEFEFGIIVKFQNLGREYLFAFTQTPDSFIESKHTTFKPITNNVYWTDRPYYWR